MSRKNRLKNPSRPRRSTLFPFKPVGEVKPESVVIVSPEFKRELEAEGQRLESKFRNFKENTENFSSVVNEAIKINKSPLKNKGKTILGEWNRKNKALYAKYDVENSPIGQRTIDAIDFEYLDNCQIYVRACRHLNTVRKEIRELCGNNEDWYIAKEIIEGIEETFMIDEFKEGGMFSIGD